MGEQVASEPKRRPVWKPGPLTLIGAALGAPIGAALALSDFKLLRNWSLPLDATAGLALSGLMILTGVLMVALSYRPRALLAALYGLDGAEALRSEVDEARLTGWWCAAAGAVVGAPVLAAVQSDLSRDAAWLVLGFTAAGLAGLAWFTWRYWATFDELVRSVSWEASGLAFDGVLVLALLWGSADLMGMELAVSPYGVFLSVVGLLVAATLFVTAKHGLYGMGRSRA